MMSHDLNNRTTLLGIKRTRLIDTTSADRMKEMSLNNMEVAALGRPFTLGMLYDVRTDELLPGLKLWDDDSPQIKIIENAKPFSALEISSSDSLESRSFLLTVDASLKASFISGLIEVGGSANYLRDKKKFQHQSRVTCQYKATTTFKELSVIDLESLNNQQVEVIRKGLATHVVTGILYGANAFFVFDSEKLDASSVQDLQCNMEAVIKKIPSFHNKGKVDIKLTDEEKALTDRFSCKFYGDFILDTNPVKFEEAVKTYVELPKLLGKMGERSVPLKVWLMPLKVLDAEAAELKAQISIGLVRKAQDVLEQLREVEMRCNDSLVDPVVEKFPQIDDRLKKFQKFCDYYKSGLQQSMAKYFPLIRAGKEEESSIQQLFQDRDNSPFCQENLTKWLENIEREINVIRSCLEIMDGVKIVKGQSQLDKDVLVPGVDHALCFVFTSLECTDHELHAMATHLDSGEFESSDVVMWKYSDKVASKMREKAKIIRDLAKALESSNRFLFLVAAMDNARYTGATIYYYREGIQITEDFSKPDLPPVRTITDKRDLIWYACDLTLDPDTVNYRLKLSEENKKATYGERQLHPDHPQRFDMLPQVLCKNSLTGRHYWEVELSYGCYDSLWIIFGYKRVERKGNGPNAELGRNKMSWAFGKTYVSKFEAWHRTKEWEGPIPAEGCRRVGVFLDWPAGTLSFYGVSFNTLEHLYTFEQKFTEPVYPGLRVTHRTILRHDNSYGYLCPL